MKSEATPEGALPSLHVEGFGSLPDMQYRQLKDGRVEFRYVVEDERQYPGFDSRWRVMMEEDRRQTLLIGGRVADWLRSLEAAGG